MKTWFAARACRFGARRYTPLLAASLAGVWLCAPAVRAHDPITTKLLWTREISRIVYRHCANCHRAGGSAPMPLTTYEEARPWAKAIRDEVLERRMPPWGAVKGVGEFRGDPSLSQTEIDILVNWVEGGAPKGDDVYLPRLPRMDAPAPPAQAPVPQEMVVGSDAGRTLDREITADGIRPRKLAPGASLEVAAYLPDGSVERLIWLRSWRPEWERTYYFLHPMYLPKGTRIAAYSGQPAEVALVLAK